MAKLTEAELHGYQPIQPYTKSVAYFSMEFAIDQALKIYAGGLGFLAGSHLRSARALQQDMIGVGILWKYGYYDQVRDRSNHMTCAFIEKSYAFLKDIGVTFTVRVHDAPVQVKAYLLRPETFGCAPLFLLSTDIPENDYLSQTITHRLYDNNEATRVAQNIILGIGGAMLLDKLGLAPAVYHLNEGHGVALNFYLYDQLRDLAEVRKRMVFTTHTPEMAGNEAHSFALLETMSFFHRLSVSEVKALLQLEGDCFNYTLAALKFAGKANGVSQMHAGVARTMWGSYPGTCYIRAITNAQQQQYWSDQVLAAAIRAKDEAQTTSRKSVLKQALFKVVADQTGKLFRSEVLTIVWARRFADYKRADLLLADWAAFQALVCQEKYPVQLIWAGKPHPEDEKGIMLFNRIIDQTASFPNCAVLTGYEMGLSALLKQGADVWLNTPRRYHEASGTSGMTAAMNGAVNLSIPDGWFPEFARDGSNCFCIPTAQPGVAEGVADEQENQALMYLLNERVLPWYYDKPSSWFNLICTALTDIGPAFDSDRMADQYYTELYN